MAFFKNQPKEQENSVQNWFFTSKAHVNLRQPNGTKPTPLYLVFKLGAKQHKVSLGVKVIPNHWNGKANKALISANLSEIENKNNFIVNKKVNDGFLAYSNMIDYLCSHTEEINNPQKAIKSIFTMANKTAKKEKLSATLYKALRGGNVAESSYNRYNGILKEFLEWVEKNHKNMTIDDLTKDILKEYIEYLFNQTITHKITHEKVKAENNTILNKIQVILVIVGYLDNDTLYNELHKVTKGIKTHKQEDNQIYLNEDEIQRIYDLTLEGKEEVARDLFIVQLSSGQRYSDIEKLSGKSLKEYVNGDMVTISQQKTKTKVSFPIDDKAKAILEKYDYTLPKMSTQDVNKHLKKIGQKAELNTIINNVELRGGDVYEYECKKWQLLTTHCSRRTFVSQSIKDNINTELTKGVTGHKSDSAFRKYNRLTAEERTKAFMKAKNNTEETNTPKTSGNTSGNAGNQASGNNTNNDKVNEYKRVLAMLEIPSYQWIDVNDEEELFRLIHDAEKRIHDNYGIGYKKLKDIFNDIDLTMGEKVEAIKELMEKYQS